jgi:hypothetical protein
VCRADVQSSLTDDLKHQIQSRIDESRQAATNNDQLIATYIGIYPWVDLQSLYTLVGMLDPSEIETILLLHPNQLKTVIKQLKRR